MSAPENTGNKGAFQSALKEFNDTFRGFWHAPRSLWGVNIANVIEGLVYFGIITILGKFCSENVGLNDVHAGWVYGAVTGGITFSMLLFGGLSDRWGVRRSLILAFVVMLAGRALVALSGTLPLGGGTHSVMFAVMSVGLLFMVVAYGVFQPATYAAVKFYAKPETAAIAYAALYGGMNLGSFLSGFVSPLTRTRFEKTFPPNGLTAVFWVYVALTAISLLVVASLMVRKGAEAAAGESHVDKAEAAKQSWLQKAFGFLEAFKDVRFMFFIFILVPVQTLFAHNWLTIPYYLDRAFAGTPVSEYYEFFSNLNPLIIFVLSPIVAALTSRLPVYPIMIVGTLIMAAPTFLLTLGPNMWLFLLFIIMMSVGEAIWSPRFLQWIAEIAPPSKVGLYQGIGQLPWFMTKMITATYSGYMISLYCPKAETGLPMQTEKLWLIHALIAMLSPIGLILAKKWMEKGTKLALH